MADSAAIAEAIFAGCGANVGPLIGVELEPGPVSVSEEPAPPPDGALGVLPLAVELDGKALARIELASPLDELASLARRMLGDGNPDEKRELSSDDLDAIGEVLNLMSAAVDQSIRAHINSFLRSRPLGWWRTDQSREGSDFTTDSCLLAAGSCSIPGGSRTSLYLRLPLSLLHSDALPDSPHADGDVVLLGVPDDVADEITPVLSSARLRVLRQDLQADSVESREQLRNARAIVLSGDATDSLERCRRLRLSNDTWRTPAIVSFRDPSKKLVIRALEHGASHVLRVPSSETELLRVLNLSRPGNA